MRSLKLAAVAVLIAAVPAVASAAGYGTGTFRGTVTSSVGAKRPHTAAVVKVRPGRARIARLGVAFHCTGEDGLPERFTQRVSSRFTKVTTGAAGGALHVTMRPRIHRGGRTYEAEVEVYAGLRAATVTGTVDAYLTDAGGATVCTDYGSFTAR